jgi:ankyrin repeat protein
MAKPAGKKKSGKKKKSKKSSSAIAPVGLGETDVLPPLTTNVRLATLQTTVINHDIISLNRLIAHYNYKNDLNKLSADKTSLIHTAIKSRDILSLQQLISYSKEHLNSRESSLLGGYAPIHYACSMNNHEILDCLIKAGAILDIKADSTIGETPLMICCKHGNLRCAQMLIQAGVRLNTLDNFGNNASFWAYRHNNTTMARELQLPASHTPSPDEFLALQMQRIPGFKLPAIKPPSSPKKGKDGDKKKKAKK